MSQAFSLIRMGEMGPGALPQATVIERFQRGGGVERMGDARGYGVAGPSARTERASRRFRGQETGDRGQETS